MFSKIIKIRFLSLISLCFISCNESIVKTNVPQSSYNIEKSKKNKVFIVSYKPLSNTLNFGNSKKKYELDEVWIEYLWSYSNINKDITTEKQKYAYVTFKDKKIDIYNFELFYDSNFTKKGGVTDNKFTFNIDDIPNNLKLVFVHEKDTAYLNLEKND